MTAGDVRAPIARGGARETSLALARLARQRRTGRLAEDVVLFAELLRSCGVPVAGGAPVRAVRALGRIGIDRRDDVGDALRATLVADRSSARVFDLIFPVFWSATDVLVTATDSEPEPAADAPGSPGGDERARAGLDGDTRRDARHSPRPTTSHRHGQPTTVDGLEDREIDEVARRVVRALARTPGRRRRPASAGDLIDLRASMRRCSRSGELFELLRTRTRPHRTRIVVLCDVSSSMAQVTALFLSLAHALARHARLTELGVFNVDLTLVGQEFRRYSRATALRRLRRREHALAGGTRVGHCLRLFLDGVEPKLTTDTVAVVLSDGWDVGAPEELATQMSRLREHVGRVLWCDPHAAAAGFDPQVRGLRAALPFVDDYLDLSGPAALRGLAEYLERNPLPRRNG